ncbi:hypothetical protein GCM10010399_43890 [Dactylosporangium fulvum]|uniref:Uncharacterized protein n=1 Tax=Dactylosporangium fulvum TaxID=53359 RepID=A0ABY5W8Y1_9ACTN|nr:hypothetical protein [Dactylosporangium fulvum]UWP85944.1 hypothetical protein Dfulv_17495 [Dactylosporangium fulvum]
MTRDLLPRVMGCGVGWGIGSAVALWPGSTPLAAVAAGVVTGMLTLIAFRVLPQHLSLEQARPGDDDGSGERPVWSSRDTEALSPFVAWARGDSSLPGADDTREMPSPVPARAVGHGTGLLRPRYRSRHRVGRTTAGAR